MTTSAVDTTPLVSGVELTAEQIQQITAAGGDVLWHGYAGNPHGEFLPLKMLDGLPGVIERAQVWFGPGLSAAMLEAAPAVQWLQANSAGVEGILIPELAQRPVTVTNVKGMHSATTAEHTMALMLSVARGLRDSAVAQARGVWSPTPISSIAPMEGSRVLILGTGMIGTAVADRCRAFGMEVHGISRSGRDVAGYASVRPVSELAEEAAKCDWLVVAAPATPGSSQLVSREVLAAMKPSAVLINISRGAVVDEPALIDALRGGGLRAAGLDVFTHEPLSEESPLWQLPNVVLTPHAGGAMQNYGDKAVTYLTRNLQRFRAGLPLHSVVDPTQGY